MIRIYLGKSAAGKDYHYRQDLEKGFLPVISYTNRPIRKGEVDGKDYNFVTKEKFLELIDKNMLLEYRAYNTLLEGKADVWYYGTPRLTDLDSNYVMVVDVDGAMEVVKAYGSDCVELVYVDASAETRTRRAKKRASCDETEWKEKRKPEWDRRLADDEIKFSKERLEELEKLYGRRIKVINND